MSESRLAHFKIAGSPLLDIAVYAFLCSNLQCFSFLIVLASDSCSFTLVLDSKILSFIIFDPLCFAL